MLLFSLWLLHTQWDGVCPALQRKKERVCIFIPFLLVTIVGICLSPEMNRRVNQNNTSMGRLEYLENASWHERGLPPTGFWVIKDTVLRSGPSQNHSIIRTVAYGEEFDLKQIGKDTKEKGIYFERNDNWFAAYSKNKKIGWIDGTKVKLFQIPLEARLMTHLHIIKNLNKSTLPSYLKYFYGLVPICILVTSLLFDLINVNIRPYRKIVLKTITVQLIICLFSFLIASIIIFVTNKSISIDILLKNQISLTIMFGTIYFIIQIPCKWIARFLFRGDWKLPLDAVNGPVIWGIISLFGVILPWVLGLGKLDYHDLPNLIDSFSSLTGFGGLVYEIAAFIAIIAICFWDAAVSLINR